MLSLANPEKAKAYGEARKIEQSYPLQAKEQHSAFLLQLEPWLLKILIRIFGRKLLWKCYCGRVLDAEKLPSSEDLAEILWAVTAAIKPIPGEQSSKDWCFVSALMLIRKGCSASLTPEDQAVRLLDGTRIEPWVHLAI